MCCGAVVEWPLSVALLGTLRDVADEIVLAVDSRLDASRLGHYASVADRLFRSRLRVTHRTGLGVAPRGAPRGDRILKLDGDEIPVLEMTRMLPKLSEATDVLQYSFRCRWPFPSPG